MKTIFDEETGALLGQETVQSRLRFWNASYIAGNCYKMIVGYITVLCSAGPLWPRWQRPSLHNIIQYL